MSNSDNSIGSDGRDSAQPGRHYNRPGLPALAYRLGTHSAFLQRMLARLPSQQVGESRPLAKLTTQDSTDPAIALLDAWATVADVLCFYQERIANESYLRTATERRSVLELARAIGYELNPGVAASTCLAFTVEEPPDVPDAQSVPGVATVPTEVTVPKGISVKSVPGPGQKPQTFETIEEIEARAVWNALKPREPWTMEAPAIQHGTQSLYLKGTNTQLQPGDAILLVGDTRERLPGSERWDWRVLKTVTPNAKEDCTYVTWEPGLGHEKPTVDPAGNPRVFAFRERAALFGYNAPDWRVLPDDLKARYIPERLMGLDFKANEVVAKRGKTLTVAEPFPYGEKRDKVNALTDDSTVFCVKGKESATLADVKVGDKVAGLVVKKKGRYVAEVVIVIPPEPNIPSTEQEKKDQEAWVKCCAGAFDDWPGFEIRSADKEIYLDSVYPKVLADSWIALVKPSYVELYKVEEVSKASRTDFTLTSKCSHLKLDAWEHLAWFGGRDRRDTMVYVQSEELVLTKIKKPLSKSVAGKEIELDRVVLGLEQGRTLVFSGKRLRARVAASGVFRLKENDKSWEQINSGLTNNDVRALVVSSGGSVFAGTGGGGVFVLPSDGKKWEARNGGLTGRDVRCLAISLGNVVFAGTAGGGVFRSRDHGVNWTQVNNGLTVTDVRALASLKAKPGPGRETIVAPSIPGLLSPERVKPSISRIVSEHVLLAGTAGGGVFRSADDGKNWEPANTDLTHRDVRALAAGESGTIFAGTAGGGIYRSANLGASWTQINSGLPDNVYVYALAINSGGTLFAGTFGSGVFYSKDNGDTWSQVNDGLESADVRSLAIDSQGHVLAGTAGGGVFRLTRKGGEGGDEYEWTQINEDLLNTDVRALATRPGERLFAGTRGVNRLVSADSLQSVALRAGDRLQIVASPSAASQREKKWRLEDRDGFTGFVEAGPSSLILELADEDDKIISEAAFVESVSHTQKRTTIFLKAALQNYYDRTTLVIYGNVARATHGETVEEVLGSGDGAQANQRFTLKKPPLTYISAATPTGGQSTLEVRVNDVLWNGLPSLYDLDAQSQSYTVRLGDDGKANVIFGDGESGARLPSGRENVRAVYRSGVGPDGAVGAGSLILLQKRPLGIRQVTNPLPASGAAAPEERDEARTKAPLTVLTLERIVSLQDHEDFARIFAGIGKAQAAALWSGESRLVHITVAAADGEEVDPTSALYLNLVNAIDKVREPVQQVRVDSYQRLYFNLKAKIRVDSRYEAEKVLDKVKMALEDAFAFKKRSFGQAVTAAGVVSVIQQVEGVIATDLDKLYLHTGKSSPGLASRLPAARAHWRDGRIQPAQLVLINPVGITLTEMSA